MQSSVLTWKGFEQDFQSRDECRDVATHASVLGNQLLCTSVIEPKIGDHLPAAVYNDDNLGTDTLQGKFRDQRSHDRSLIGHFSMRLQHGAW